MHPHQFVSVAEGDAHIWTLAEHRELAAVGAGVQVDDTFLVSKVHREDVGMAVCISDAYHAIGALLDDVFYFF